MSPWGEFRRSRPSGGFKSSKKRCLEILENTPGVHFRKKTQ